MHENTVSIMTHSEILPEGEFKFTVKSKLSHLLAFKQGLKTEIGSVRTVILSESIVDSINVTIST